MRKQNKKFLFPSFGAMAAMATLASASAFAAVPPDAPVQPVRKVGKDQKYEIKFAVPKDEPGKVPYYANKLDFARLDCVKGDPECPVDYSISQEALNALRPEDLAQWTQEEIDQLYARLPSGPIPNGPFQGHIIMASGGGMQYILDKFGNKATEALFKDQSVLKRVAQALKLDPNKGDADIVRAFGESLWNGKVFYRNSRILRNLMDAQGLATISTFALAPSLLNTFFTPQNAGNLVLAGQKIAKQFAGDYTKPDTTLASGSFQYETVKDGKPVTGTFEPQKFHRLFPAKLYCGQSLLDSRKESVIIDYAYSDDIDGYSEVPLLNFIAMRKGLAIRDEIRMIRPGFYLGRAYGAKMFLLNFTLYNPNFKEGADAPTACDVPVRRSSQG